MSWRRAEWLICAASVLARLTSREPEDAAARDRRGRGTPGPGWNLIVLQHTDCGITRLGGQPDLVAATFGIDAADLPAKAVGDPRAAVAVDVAQIKANPFLPAEFIVSGLVYDVRTGLIETIAAPSKLRDREAA